MKIESSSLLTPFGHLRSATAKNSAGPAPAVSGDGFSSRPHADFETNRAALLAGTRGNSIVRGGTDTFSEPISNQDVNQTGFQEKLIADLGPQFARMQFTHDCSQLQGMIPTKGQLQREFDKLAGDESIPFEYIYDGCYARAHLMCEQMQNDNVNCSKMFVMVENPYGAGKLTAENKYMEAKWWYHVAPMTFAVDEQTKAVEPFIMDPSMADHPMKPQEWIHAMWDEKTRIKVDVTHALQYGPLESDGANSSFEESIAPSHEVLAEYSAELAKIKEDYNHQHPRAA